MHTTYVSGFTYSLQLSMFSLTLTPFTDGQMRALCHPARCPLPGEAPFWATTCKWAEQHSRVKRCVLIHEGDHHGLALAGRRQSHLFFLSHSSQLTSHCYLCGLSSLPGGLGGIPGALVLLVCAMPVYVNSAVEHWTQSKLLDRSCKTLLFIIKNSLILWPLTCPSHRPTIVDGEERLGGPS